MVPLGTLMEVRQMLGSELVTRYNLYPAAPIYKGPLLRKSAPARGSQPHGGKWAAPHNLPQGIFL